MTRERAKTFADRLPPVVPREEEDISHLGDEMADILYPGRRPRPFRIAVTFDAFDGPDHSRAVDLARRSPLYTERVDGKRVPYASELWLPLFWLFVTGEESA